MVEADLGAPIDDLFSSFSVEPIAAASIAQVYRATLRSTGAPPHLPCILPSQFRVLRTTAAALWVLFTALFVLCCYFHGCTQASAALCCCVTATLWGWDLNPTMLQWSHANPMVR